MNSLLEVLLKYLMISSAISDFDLVDHQQDKISAFQSIYQFGDSVADVGNLIRQGQIGAASRAARLPYGETYHKPTGRFSDGLLMIDYIANALHLPLLNPYLKKGASFEHGVNFAVAGATALDSSFFKQRNITDPRRPLSVQLQWFKIHLNSICTTQKECTKRLERALFFVGEIGGNDYNYPFFQGKPINEIQTYVPSIVGAIANAVREVIKAGAIQIVVPGNFPIGCIPSYLTMFRTNNVENYDNMKCLRSLNEFAMLHNKYLQGALDKLRREFPGVVIVYADYYNAFLYVLYHATSLGFDKASLLRACCGNGGEYNYNSSKVCGSAGVKSCPNPDQHISWDGIHLTQEAYKHMSDWLLAHILPKSNQDLYRKLAVDSSIPCPNPVQCIS